MNKLNKDIELARTLCQKRLQEMQMLRVERKKLSQRMRHIKLENQKAEMLRFEFLYKFVFICIDVYYFYTP